jgi:hypothetical protein
LGSGRRDRQANVDRRRGQIGVPGGKGDRALAQGERGGEVNGVIAAQTVFFGEGTGLAGEGAQMLDAAA